MKTRPKSVYLMERFSAFVFNAIVMVDYHCVTMSTYAHVLALTPESTVSSLRYSLRSITELRYSDILC